MDTVNSNDRIAETLYSLGTRFVSGICVVCINTLHKGDNGDGVNDDDDDDNINNSYYYYYYYYYYHHHHHHHRNTYSTCEITLHVP